MKAKGFTGLVNHLRNHPRWAWAGALLENGLNRLHGLMSRFGWYRRRVEGIQARHKRCCARVELARDWLSRAWGLIRTGKYESKVDLRQGLRDLVRPKDKR
jgi:hypothetical protein